MDSLSSGEPASSWPSVLHSAFHSFVSPLSFLNSNPTFIAILLAITLVPFVLWVDTIGKNPASSLNKMAVKDPSAEFKGNIKVNNNPPTKEDLEKVADLPVLDKDGKKHTFKGLYADNENGPRRVLIIFIRHFFCGVCSPIHTSFLPRMTLTNNRRIVRSISVPLHPPSPPTLSPPSPHPQKSSSSVVANPTSYPCTFMKQGAHFPSTPTHHENYTIPSA